MLLERGQIGNFEYEIQEHDIMGHLCGYIGIPEEHPWFDKFYDEIPAEVHGGLTYSSWVDYKWWIGFDCAHAGDFISGLTLSLSNVGILPGEDSGHKWTRDEVYAELERLVEQAQNAQTLSG